MSYSVFTSESVCSGHPDKICDQISDAVVDAALLKDPNARVAVETLVTRNYVTMAGEVTLKGKLSYKKIAQAMIKKLGYTDSHFKFTDKSPIVVKIHTQSPEIAVGVDNLGAGDQGMMFGYACSDTPEYMPLPIALSHALARQIDLVREKKVLPYLRPDGKTQVTVQYENGKPKGIETVVIAVPHHEKIKQADLKIDIVKHVINPVLLEYGFSVKPEQVIINGTGVWYIGGPASDTGVTGRKIIVDTYGGMARVGGGCFSGKDPTKVDRSGAYAARFLAKNIVANGFAKRAEIRLAYVIGGKKPLMLDIETFGTEKKSQSVIKSYMNSILDTSVSGIIKAFQLKRPIYLQTARYGHFGKKDVPWEKVVDSC